jgi:hypothetical protein
MTDLFDKVLDSEVSVWKKGTGTVDGYGIESQIFFMIAQGVKCRVDYGAGKELDTEAAFGVQEFTFYMRPLLVDNPPVRLSIHHWLQINIENKQWVADPNPNGTMYDILNVKNRAGHHFEIDAKLIEP